MCFGVFVWVWGKAGVRGWRQGCINTPLPLWAPSTRFNLRFSPCVRRKTPTLRTYNPPPQKIDRTYPFYLLHQPARGEKKLVKCGTSQEEIITLSQMSCSRRRCSLAQSDLLGKRNKNASTLHFLCNRVKACVCGVNADFTEAVVGASTLLKVWSPSQTCCCGEQLSIAAARTQNWATLGANGHLPCQPRSERFLRAAPSVTGQPSRALADFLFLKNFIQKLNREHLLLAQDSTRSKMGAKNQSGLSLS